MPFSAVWSRSTILKILSSLIRIYTIYHSQQSDQGLSEESDQGLSEESDQGLHCLPFSVDWSECTFFAICRSLIKVKVHCHPEKHSDQGLHYLPFSALWSWSTLFPILSKQYYQGRHCLSFFLTSFIKVYTVCHFQLSDQGLHYLSLSAVWSGSTLFPILSSLIKLYTICHSQSDQGLQYLPFSAVWSGSTLYAILSKQYHKVYTVCHSEHSDQGLHYLLHCLPFSVWSGSTMFRILSSLIRVYITCHSEQWD